MSRWNLYYDLDYALEAFEKINNEIDRLEYQSAKNGLMRTLFSLFGNQMYSADRLVLSEGLAQEERQIYERLEELYEKSHWYENRINEMKKAREQDASDD